MNWSCHSCEWTKNQIWRWRASSICCVRVYLQDAPTIPKSCCGFARPAYCTVHTTQLHITSGRATGTDDIASNHFSCLPLHPAPAHLLPLFLSLSSSQGWAPQTNSQDDEWWEPVALHCTMGRLSLYDGAVLDGCVLQDHHDPRPDVVS